MDLPFSISSSFLLLCIIINIQDYIGNIYTKEKKKQEKQLWPSRKVSTGQYNVVIDVQKQYQVYRASQSWPIFPSVKQIVQMYNWEMLVQFVNEHSDFHSYIKCWALLPSLSTSHQ